MSRTLVLPARLTIAEVEDLARQLRSALMGHPQVVLDAEALDCVDTAGLQLLVVFVHEARERAVEVRWTGVGAALREGGRLLGLAEALGIADAGADP